MSVIHEHQVSLATGSVSPLEVSVARSENKDERGKFSLPNLSIEMRLVCACLRWPVDGAVSRAIHTTAADVADWPQVQRLATRHRVSGMVANALRQARVDMPIAAAAQFEGSLRQVGFGELRSANEARRVMDRLASSGLRPRLLKGPAVALSAFGRLGLRINRDVDILVAEADAPAAMSLLQELGYRRVEPPADATPGAVAAWRRLHKDMAFRNAGGMLLELHWRLFDNRHLLPGVDDVPREQAAAAAIAFATLPRRFTILYLCVHGAQHAWSRLKWLADVAAMLRQSNEAELRALIVEARRRQVLPALSQALLLCERHLGLALPQDIAVALRRSWRARLLVAIAERSMFAGNGLELEQLKFGSTLKNLSHYLIADGARYRLAELWFDLTDLSASGLPDSWRRLGPAARPVAWLWKRRPAVRLRLARTIPQSSGSDAR